MTGKRIILTLVVLATGAGMPARAQQPQRPQPPQPPQARVERGWLGFSYMVRGEHMEMQEPGVVVTPKGVSVLVGEVLKGSPADRAGMEPGDTIVRVNGEPANLVRIGAAARGLHPGDTVRVDVRRGGREQRLTLVAAPRPEYLAGRIEFAPFMQSMRIPGDSIRRTMRLYLDSARIALDSMPFPHMIVRRDSMLILQYGKSGRTDTVRLPHMDSLRATMRRFGDGMAMSIPSVHVWRGDEMGMPGMEVEIVGRRSIAGASLQELNSQLAGYFGVREGLLVESVARETPAARAGLQAGDVVTAADGRPVGDIADLRRALPGRQGAVKLDVLRKGKKHQLELKWP